MADNYIPTPRGNYQDLSNVNTPSVAHRANVSVSFTRPNDSNAYSINDVMGTSTSVLLQFPAGRFGAQGDSGYIHGVRYIKSNSFATNTVFKLFLFSSPVADSVDNAVSPMSFADAASYIGDWSPPTMVANGSIAMIRDATRFGYVIPGQFIYGVLTATAAYAPQPNEQFTIMLYLEQTAVA